MRDNPRPVGIIANPQSGKDIRRISAYGFVANNHEKVNVIQKVLLGLDSAGITEVFYMPEAFGIVPRAAESLALSLAVMPVDLEPGYTAEDSTCAARLMEEIGAGCIVTLGGDGTNRAVFKGARQTPLLPISAGTNNVFPMYIDGTIAGVAAGLFTRMGADRSLCRRKKVISVRSAGKEVDLALIDAAVCSESFVGSRAVVDVEKVRSIVISEIRAEVIGLASIAWFVDIDGVEANQGVYLSLAGNGKPKRSVAAPVAPGVIAEVPITECRHVSIGEVFTVEPADSVIALDGEREIEVSPESELSITIEPDGPYVVDVGSTIRKAKDLELFVRAPANAGRTE